MLGFSPEDRAKIGEARRRQGWRDISLASDVQLPAGAGGAAAKQSLADSWVDFLQQQIEADSAAAAAAAAVGSGSSGPAAPPPPVL